MNEIVSEVIELQKINADLKKNKIILQNHLNDQEVYNDDNRT